MPPTTGYAQALSARTTRMDVTPNEAFSAFVRVIRSSEPNAFFASCSDIGRSGSFVCGQIKIASPAVNNGISIPSGMGGTLIGSLLRCNSAIIEAEARTLQINEQRVEGSSIN